MADEELHETTADDQKDWQAETDAEAGTSAEETTGDEAAAKSEDNDDDLDIPMDRVEAVLNATADKDSLSPQMQRMMNRQAENTRRVEETIKGTKSNPRWFVPLFCALMIIGLVWAVVYYLTSDYPIPHIGAWNLAIAFAIIMIGTRPGRIQSFKKDAQDFLGVFFVSFSFRRPDEPACQQPTSIFAVRNSTCAPPCMVVPNR